MPDTFSLAPEVAKIAKPIIKQHHDHLASRRLEFLFVERLDKDGHSQAITVKGKSLYGKAKLVTGLNAFLAGGCEVCDTYDEATPLFVILITKHFWTGATIEFKEALVDHELSHCWYDSETDRYSMIDHDIAEFTAIVKRHGAWKSDLDQFFKAAKQTKLTFSEAVEPETPAAVRSAGGSVSQFPTAN